MALTQTRSENKPLLQDDAGFLQEITSTAVEVGLKGLVCDVDANDIAEYRSKRLAAGVTNRTANYETGALRGILRQYGLWGPIADRRSTK